VFDVSVFVDASERLPLEQGMTVTPDMCDIVVQNNGTLKEFMKKIDVLREVFHTI